MLELLQWLALSSSPWVLDLSSCVLVVLTGPLTMMSLLIPLSKFSFLSFIQNLFASSKWNSTTGARFQVYFVLGVHEFNGASPEKFWMGLMHPNTRCVHCTLCGIMGLMSPHQNSHESLSTIY